MQEVIILNLLYYINLGIDDDGDVANFVETETLIFYNQYCCSHVQIRGSVPVFWQQRGITAQTKITRTLETGNSAFLKHFNYLMRNYTRVLCVNLMARSKTQEQMITDEYENHIIKNNLPNVRYEFFDFHHACKGQKFDHVNPLIKKLQLMNENFRFYVEDTRNNTVIMTQKGYNFNIQKLNKQLSIKTGFAEQIVWIVWIELTSL